MTSPVWTECPLHGAYVLLAADDGACPTCGVVWSQLDGTHVPAEQGTDVPRVA